MANPNGDYRAGSGTDFRAQKSLREMNGSLSQQAAATDRAINRELAALRQQKAYQSAAGTKTVAPESNRAVPGAMDRPSPVRANRQLVPVDQPGRLRAGAPLQWKAELPAPPVSPRAVMKSAARGAGTGLVLDTVGNALPISDAKVPFGTKAKMALDSATKAIGAGAGSAVGGAAGALTGPAAPVLAPAGAFAGGVAGYNAADSAGTGVRALINKVNGALGGDPNYVTSVDEDLRRLGYDTDAFFRTKTASANANGPAEAAPTPATAAPSGANNSGLTYDDAARIGRNEAMLAAFDAREQTSRGTLRSAFIDRPPAGYSQQDRWRSPAHEQVEANQQALRDYREAVEQQAQAAEAYGKYGRAWSLRAEGARLALQEAGLNSRDLSNHDVTTNEGALDRESGEAKLMTELQAKVDQAQLDREAAAAKAKADREATREKDVWGAEQDLAKRALEGDRFLAEQLKAQHGNEKGAAAFQRYQTLLNSARNKAGIAVESGVIKDGTLFHNLFGGEQGKDLTVKNLTKQQLDTLSVLASDSPLGKSLSMIDPALYSLIVGLDETGQVNALRNHATNSAMVGTGTGLIAAAVAGAAKLANKGKALPRRYAAIPYAAGAGVGALNYMLGEPTGDPLAADNLNAQNSNRKLRELRGNN